MTSWVPPGVPRRAEDGSVLASPAARRLLRDAGVDLAAVTATTDGRRVTRADAERLVDELGGQAARPQGTERQPSAPSPVEIEIDVALLLGSIAATRRDFIAHNGFPLSAEVALATAVGTVLVRRPELGPSDEPQARAAGRTYPGVHVGFPRPAERGSAPAVIADVQDLTVAGLARRARAAVRADDDPTAAATTRPTVVVATEDAAGTELADSASLGLLTITEPAPRRVTTVDHLGHEVLHTRPHVTVRLHPAERTTADTAADFLDELAAALASWSLPVGP